MKKSIFTLTLILLVGFVFAQEDTENSENTESTLTFNGYVDSYYSYNLNRPGNLRNTGRVFDYRHNTFSVGLIQTQLNYQRGDLEVVGDLTFGPNGVVSNYGNAIAGSAIIIKQAYISYHFTDKLTFTAGQYGTHMGFEPIEAYLNFNYSLSYQFAYGPIYHVGVKFDFEINDKWSVMAGLVNGWDEFLDANEKKSVTLQVATTAIPNAELALNWIGGDEYGSPANFGNFEGSYTSLIDFAGRYQVTDQFMIGTNAGYGYFKTAAQVFNGNDPYSASGNWWAAALYLQYYFTDDIGIGFRGEKLNDPNNLRSGLGTINGLTFTVDYKLGDSYMIKPEIRIDTSENAIYNSSDGNNTTQPTIGIAFIGVIK